MVVVPRQSTCTASADHQVDEAVVPSPDTKELIVSTNVDVYLIGFWSTLDSASLLGLSSSFCTIQRTLRYAKSLRPHSCLKCSITTSESTDSLTSNEYLFLMWSEAAMNFISSTTLWCLVWLAFEMYNSNLSMRLPTPKGSNDTGPKAVALPSKNAWAINVYPKARQ